MSKEASENSLDLLKTCQANGWMKIENPEKLSTQLTARYGDKAPDLIMEAVNNPSGLMKKIGQEPTTPTNTLNYLVSDDISKDSIQKLGGKVEAESFVSTVEPIVTENQATVQDPAPQGTDFSQLGNTNVYGDKINTQQEASQGSSNETDPYYDDEQNNNQSQYSDPWSELFSNLMSGDLGKMLGAALAIQMLNQTHLAFGPHYTPFPHHCHPYRDRIDYFNDCVDNRSKTEKVLDKVADVAHGVGILAHGTGHLIGAIKGKDRGMG